MFLVVCPANEDGFIMHFPNLYALGSTVETVKQHVIDMTYCVSSYGKLRRAVSILKRHPPFSPSLLHPAHMLLPVLSCAIRVPAELPAPVNPRSEEPNGRSPSFHAVLLHQTASAQTDEHPAVSEAALLCHVVHTDQSNLLLEVCRLCEPAGTL